MNPQLAQFQKQAQRGQSMSREELYPGTITFGENDPINCSVRADISLSRLDDGFELNRPKHFIILRADLPDGVTLIEKRTRFVHADQEWRLVSLLPNESDAQIHFIADLPSAKPRG